MQGSSKIVLGGVLGVIAGLLLAAGLWGNRWLKTQLGPQVKARAERLISERFGGEAHIDSLDVNLRPTPRVVGRGVTLRAVGSEQPLIQIKEFTAAPDLATLLGRENRHISRVTLEGLVIQISHTFQAAPHQHGKFASPAENHLPFIIDELVADGTRLLILPKDSTKAPLEFDIQKLSMHSVGVGQPMSFVATLQNATPPGLIQTGGKFGPWQRDAPRRTPVQGHYTFKDADLSVFKGISGRLSSVGDYSGVLDTISVKGSTETPGFTVTTGGHPVALHTNFEATVDGTNGNTSLHPVDAKFLKSELICSGTVEGQPGTKGKFVKLHVVTKAARVEDLLRLCVRSDKPFLTGATSLQTDFVLPPGKEEVMHKLQLRGAFSISSAQFPNPNIQDRLLTLSRRSRGITKPNEQGNETVTSDFRGHLDLNAAIATFHDLTFAVPGAQIELSGTYGIKSEDIDMHGSARLEARLSQMTGGLGSVFLKLADPFFEKHGAGTYLPISITGTREHPSFGLDFRRKQ